MKSAVSFLVGLIFALGLGISGMTQTHIVRGFLDILGSWNPALMGVMVGAIAVHVLAYQWVRHRKSPFLETHFHMPTRQDIDARLLIGAALFGLGWGWAGICPGPGIVAATSGNANILTFVVSMLAGMAIFKMLEPKLPGAKP